MDECVGLAGDAGLCERGRAFFYAYGVVEVLLGDGLREIDVWVVFVVSDSTGMVFIDYTILKYLTVRIIWISQPHRVPLPISDHTNKNNPALEY